MLSLPLIPPQADILRTGFRPRSDSPPPRSSGTEHAQHRQQQRETTSSKTNAHNTHSPLALLTADENAIAARKLAIRDFGASWIRPPGVAKTLQASREEEAELEEQNAAAIREQNLRDLQARQEVEEARTRAQEGDEDAEEEEEDDRDLDAEIPDADAETADVTFNEDSMVEGSNVGVEVDQEEYDVREEAELTGAARDEEELGIEHERDLDDSVPEAGSYQHTDTEVEDSTSSEEEDSDLQDSFAAQSARRATRRPEQSQAPGATMSGSRQGGLQERIRAQVGRGNGGDALMRSPGSLNLSSPLVESSFIGSSPVLRRGRGGDRGRRSRMS